MAAAAPNITKVNLELGGKAPAIVMADADIDLAVKAIKASRVINSGQVCNCAERVYVQRKVADRVHRQADRRDEGHALRRSAGGRVGGIRPADQRGRLRKVDALVRERGGGGSHRR